MTTIAERREFFSNNVYQPSPYHFTQIPEFHDSNYDGFYDVLPPAFGERPINCPEETYSYSYTGSDEDYMDNLVSDFDRMTVGFEHTHMPSSHYQEPPMLMYHFGCNHAEPAPFVMAPSWNNSLEVFQPSEPIPPPLPPPYYHQQYFNNQYYQSNYIPSTFPLPPVNNVMYFNHGNGNGNGSGDGFIHIDPSNGYIYNQFQQPPDYSPRPTEYPPTNMGPGPGHYGTYFGSQNQNPYYNYNEYNAQEYYETYYNNYYYDDYYDYGVNGFNFDEDYQYYNHE